MPRAGLSEDRVVEEAERLADEVGLARLTLAALAERLGVRQPSLYKHITGMEGLQRSIAIRAQVELTDVLARAAVGRWREDAIVAMAHAYRDWAHKHPGRYTASQGAPAAGDTDHLAAALSAVEVVADVLYGFDLRGDDAIDAIRALRSALHGFVSLEAAGGFGLPLDVDRSFDRLVRGMVTAFSNWADQPRPDVLLEIPGTH
ncbi:MAG: TetR-like C-terminal domain-containing protein [Acidimicrobiales bacterium]